MSEVEVLNQNLVEVSIEPTPVIDIEVAPSSIVEIEILTGGIVYRGEQTTSLNSTSHAASTNLSALRFVIVNDENEFEYASSDTADHLFKTVGILKSAIAEGTYGEALVQGSLSDSNWNWTLGVPIYLGLNGVLTQAPPSLGFQLIVGKPTNVDTVYFETGEPILL